MGVKIPEGVDVAEKEGYISVSRGDTELKVPILDGVSFRIENGEACFRNLGDTRQSRSNWGTMRSLFANAVSGVVSGYEKTLVLEGVGYRASLEGDVLSLSLGFSHPVKYQAPEGIAFSVDGNTIKVSGADKQLVGETAARIRSFRPVEPYKGKGLRYENEVVRRKVGKKAATA